MTSKIWVLLAVTIVSVIAGVAVAGIPDGRSTELSDIVTAPTTEPTADTTPDTVPDSTVPDSTVPESTVPPDTDLTTDETSTTTDTEPAPDAPTTEPTTPTTSVAEPTTPTTRPAADRSVVSVVVANGARVGGAAGDVADRLTDAGYPNIRTLDGAEIVGVTTVYAGPGFQAEAEQLAIDVGIDPGLVFPLSSAPEVLGDFDEPLLVYLGTDIAALL